MRGLSREDGGNSLLGNQRLSSRSCPLELHIMGRELYFGSHD